MGISLDHCVVLPHTDINVTQRDKGADCPVLVMCWANHFPTAEECTLHRPSGPARLRVHRECETRISVHRAQHDVNRIKMDECVAVVFQNQRARVFLKLSELFLASLYFLSNLWIWVVSAASQRHVGVKVFYVEQKHAVLRNSVVWPLAFASMVGAKAANGGQVKTGQRMWPGTQMFYPVVCILGKPNRST